MKESDIDSKKIDYNYNSVCPKCGERFNCGYIEGKDHCWCSDVNNYPHIKPKTGDSCFCKKCLSEKITSKIK